MDQFYSSKYTQGPVAINNLLNYKIELLNVLFLVNILFIDMLFEILQWVGFIRNIKPLDIGLWVQ
jgi:hypothetical protein